MLPLLLTLLLLVLAAPAAHAGPAPLTMRVVSYNVWGVPHIAPERSERVARIGERLAELAPDRLALQEVWLDEDAAVLGRRLAAAGLVHQRHFGPSATHSKGAGLWFASRYPFERVDFVPYAAGQKVFIPWHVDYMANKGFALAQLRTAVGSVNVVNTHMQSSYIFYHYRATRLAQALQLAAGLAATASEMPLILAGDLNDTPESLPFRAISGRAGMLSASDRFALDAVLLRSGNRLNTRVASVQELFTEAVRLSSGTSMALSDHPCVVVDLSIEGCDGCAAASLPGAVLPGAVPAGAGPPGAVPPVAGLPAAALSPAALSPAALRDELRGALASDVNETEILLWLFRASFALLLAAGWLAWRRRRPRKMVWRLALTALLLVTGGWCVYAAWDWAPYKLEMLDQQQRLLLVEAGTPTIVSVRDEP